MANPFFSGRIPKELFQRAEEYIKENDKTKTELLIEALAQYLDFPLERNIPKPEVTLEMFNELKEKFEKLESSLITNENKNDNSNEKTESVPDNREDNISDNNNKDDKTPDNREDNISDNNNKDDKTPDNKNDKEIDNKDFILVSHADLPKIAGITIGDRGNLRKKAYDYAKEKGYEIAAGIKFKPAIEVNLKKGIKIKGEEYLLFCEGINEKDKPEWRLEKSDNNCYQQDIIVIR